MYIHIEFNIVMKFDWNLDKNELLKKTRGFGFKDIIFYIENGFVIKDAEHTNKEKYPNQRIYYININDYIYQVPYVVNRKNNSIFLKTIIPTRKWTKILLNK